MKKPRRSKQQKPAKTRNGKARKKLAKVPPPAPAEPEVEPDAGDVLAGLDPKAVAILTEVRRNPGMSMSKIAERLELDRGTVADRIKSPRFQRALHEITLKATQLLDRYAPDAARKLGEIMNQNESPKLQMAAAKALLHHHMGTTLTIGRKEPAPPEGVSEYDAKEIMKQWVKDLIHKQAVDAETEN